jgi:hypothetical protein
MTPTCHDAITFKPTNIAPTRMVESIRDIKTTIPCDNYIPTTTTLIYSLSELLWSVLESPGTHTLS